ncbi:MAG: threonine--tRNA ligase [Patescibacteria group bacterium]
MKKIDDKIQEKDWDHKKLGRELDLFTFSDTVGKGLPLWTPKGAAIRREIERFIVDEEIKRDYNHVYTPDIAKLDLYKKSGHYPYYKESMYAPIQIEDEEYMLRPMTCPHHFELFLDKPRSYKELPIRYAELGKLYRFEKSGELMGLQRVRSFCLADAHIICSKDQAESEADKVLELIDYAAKVFGLEKNKDYFYRLSLGDRKDEKKYFKDDESWDHAEEVLRKVLKKDGSKFIEAPGEAAFYGPKIDVQMINANGKEDTAFTVQYDFVMPKRFKLEYINEEGGKTEAVVVHRSSIGAIERIIAFLIEKYKGNFPTWLTPVQVKILPIADRNMPYAMKIKNVLRRENVRVEVDERNETLGGKIRDAQLEKVAYMLIVGDRDEKTNKVSIRKRNGDDLGSLDLKKFILDLKTEIDTKSLN